jgi:hypothetical protein
MAYSLEKARDIQISDQLKSGGHVMNLSPRSWKISLRQ